MTDSLDLLETERLIIRDFVEADFDDVHAYGSDPDVVRYMPFPPSTPSWGGGAIHAPSIRALRGGVSHPEGAPTSRICVMLKRCCRTVARASRTICQFNYR